jgi:hypothetical protein
MEHFSLSFVLLFNVCGFVLSLIYLVIFHLFSSIAPCRLISVIVNFAISPKMFVSKSISHKLSGPNRTAMTPNFDI